MSRTKASFSHLQLPLLDGCLERKLRFHVFNCLFLRNVLHESFIFTPVLSYFGEVLHESFVFTSSTSRFRGTSRMNALFSQLQLSVFLPGRRENFNEFSLIFLVLAG